jgi:hypothetical protein
VNTISFGPPGSGRVKGEVTIFIAYEVAHSIDLSRAKELQNTLVADPLSPREKTPSFQGFQVPPLTFSLPCDSLSIHDHTTSPCVDVTLFDFGAISLRFSIPFHTLLSTLRDLSVILYDNDSFNHQGTAIVNRLLRDLKPAFSNPLLSPLREDYVLFEINEVESNATTLEYSARNRELLVGILAGEEHPLSMKRSDLLFTKGLSYTTQDLLLTDWHAAILLRYDDHDIRRVLEFANVELLELRYLDQKLDTALDDAYNLIAKPPLPFFRVGSLTRDLKRLARHEVDSAILFEGINDALKLFPDQHLAQVYQQWTSIFGLTGLDSSITRKLEVLESVYRKAHDQLAQMRMELLEVVIILLFVISLLKG